MKNFIAFVKRVFCSHRFRTIHTYDQDTIKAECTKCGKKYVINKKHNWKFVLDDQSEKDYEELRRKIREFQENYYKGQTNTPGDDIAADH